MSISQDQFSVHISQLPSTFLDEIVSQGNICTNGRSKARAIAKEIWKQSSSPAQLAFTPRDFDDIVGELAKRLKIDLKKKQGWEALNTLTDTLLPADQQVSAESLPPELIQRLKATKTPVVAGVSATSTAAATRFGANWILRTTAGPWLKWIALLPKIGPTVIGIRSALGLTAAISGPVGIALGLWTLNKSLGPKYDKSLPLLIGVGLALRAHPMDLAKLEG